MIQAPVADFIKLFRHNLPYYWHITLSLDSYAVRDTNYVEKSFVKLTTEPNVLKLVLSVIYKFSHKARVHIRQG
jgi:hypothetical protein